MCLLVTGAAGFIGFHLAKERLARGDTVVGLDNLDPYYDVCLKEARLKQLKDYANFTFYHADICDNETLKDIFIKHRFQRVAHLAAQAGVRYSLENPHVYVQTNVVGFTHLIEACRYYGVEHLVYASTSAVYGANTTYPYKETDATNHPLAMYAASKKVNELIAHSYSHLYRLPTTGLRFFTVYGPWGRPDMAFFSFTRNILTGRPIQVYNNGQMQRDFTYVDDIITGLSAVIDKPAAACLNWSSDAPDAGTSNGPYRIYNIGRGEPIHLLEYIEAIELATGKKAIKEFLPMQPGDVHSTHADTTRMQQDFGYEATINAKEGVARFVQWYLEHWHGN